MACIDFQLDILQWGEDTDIMDRFIYNLIFENFLGWFKVRWHCAPNLVGEINSYCQEHGEVIPILIDGADIMNPDDLFRVLTSGFELPETTSRKWNELLPGFKTRLTEANTQRFVIYIYNGNHLLCRMPGDFFEIIGIIDQLNTFEFSHVRVSFLLDLAIYTISPEHSHIHPHDIYWDKSLGHYDISINSLVPMHNPVGRNVILDDMLAEEECWFWVGEDRNHDILSEIKTKVGTSRDLRFVILDSNKLQTDDDFWDELSAQLNFPSYFGRNFNALNDCLGDLPFEEYGTIEFVHYVFYMANLDFSSNLGMICDFFLLLSVLGGYAIETIPGLRFTLLLELPSNDDRDAALSASKWRSILFRRHKMPAEN